MRAEDVDVAQPRWDDAAHEWRTSIRGRDPAGDDLTFASRTPPATVGADLRRLGVPFVELPTVRFHQAEHLIRAASETRRQRRRGTPPPTLPTPLDGAAAVMSVNSSRVVRVLGMESERTALVMAGININASAYRLYVAAAADRVVSVVAAAQTAAAIGDPFVVLPHVDDDGLDHVRQSAILTIGADDRARTRLQLDKWAGESAVHTRRSVADCTADLTAARIPVLALHRPDGREICVVAETVRRIQRRDGETRVRLATIAMRCIDVSVTETPDVVATLLERACAAPQRVAREL